MLTLWCGMNYDAETFRRNLRIQLERKGISVNAFAKSAGIAEGTIRNILDLTAETAPRADTLLKICATLGRSLHEMLGLESGGVQEHAGQSFRSQQDVNANYQPLPEVEIAEAARRAWAIAQRELNNFDVVVVDRAVAEAAREAARRKQKITDALLRTHLHRLAHYEKKR